MSAVQVHLYRPAKREAFQLRVESHADGIGLLMYLVQSLLSEHTDGFAYGFQHVSDHYFPTVNFQQVGDRWFLQMYATESISPSGEEGWWNLVEADFKAGNVEELVHVDFEANAIDGFFPVWFAEGAWFSKKLLVGTDTLRKALRAYRGPEKLTDWLGRGRWINLGVL